MKKELRFGFFQIAFCLNIYAIAATNNCSLYHTPVADNDSIPHHGTGYASIVSAVDSIVFNLIKSEDIPGLTVAVSKGGRLILEKGYGYANYTDQTPMRYYTISRIGSVSKIFTTCGVMKLTEENLSFKVTDQVYGADGVLKDWRDYKAMYMLKDGRQYEKIRINHLLSHTSGFDGSGETRGTADCVDKPIDEVTYKDINLCFLRSKKLLFEPGTDYAYSNHGMGFAGNIVADISGMSYYMYIREKILKPLGLSTRIVPHTIGADTCMSDAHKKSNNGTIVVIPRQAGNKIPNGLAAGGWAASAGDMVRFMLATDKLENHADILRPETIDLMETQPYPNVPNSHALGWGIKMQGDAKKLSHVGKVKGGVAYITKFGEGFIDQQYQINVGQINIALCTNSGDVESKALRVVADQIALIVAKSDILPDYDLFDMIHR